jgi:hypothetical protein
VLALGSKHRETLYSRQVLKYQKKVMNVSRPKKGGKMPKGFYTVEVSSKLN